MWMKPRKTGAEWFATPPWMMHPTTLQFHRHLRRITLTVLVLAKSACNFTAARAAEREARWGRGRRVPAAKPLRVMDDCISRWLAGCGEFAKSVRSVGGM